MRRRIAVVVAGIAALLAAVLLAPGPSGAPQSAGGSVHPAGWGKPVPGLLPKPGLQAVPTRVMFDTTTPGALAGLSPQALAGYTAGRWITFPIFARSYPHAVVKGIAIGWGYRASCLDVEPGDAVPGQVVAWIRADRAAGFKRPCVYSSLWEFVNLIRPLLARAGVARASIFEWDADYNGRAAIDPTFDATQFTDKAYGRNLDESVVTLPFLGIARPAPLPRCIHRRESRAACSAARARIASDRRALAASWRALDGSLHQLAVNECRRPYRRPVCRSAGRGSALFTHRVRFFAAQARAVEAAS